MTTGKGWLTLRRFAEIMSSVAIGCVCGLVVGTAASASSFQQNPEVERFIDELVVEHRFDRGQLRNWFGQARMQRGVLKAISSPVTERPWYEFRARHVTAARVRDGLDYWQRNADTLARASAEYGVPEEIMVATVGIETLYGRNTGGNVVFDALATLAFAYPPRAALFRDQLKHLLLLARELRENPLRYKGSYAGALGVPQFLPGSYRRYAVDFDNDGKRDLWNHNDAIGSIANYYKSHGWRPGEPVVAALEQTAEPAGEEFQLLLERGLNPHTTIAASRRAGAPPAEPLPDDLPAGVFGAQNETGVRY